MDLLKEYHEWHKKLVNTNGETVPEWFWLLTDQGILGHIIRENDYHVNTLTNKISLKWYLPENPDLEKEVDFKHIWLDKINTIHLETQEWFNEIVNEFQRPDIVSNDVRWKKYWEAHDENN